MHKTLRQMILGLGTFGTGTALLYTGVPPPLLVLADTVVGVGMLFAAGSVTVDDLRFRKQAPGDGAVIDELTSSAADVPAGGGESFGLFRKFGKSSRTPPGQVAPVKETKEDHEKEVDRMLDETLAGRSKRLISLAEGQGGGTAAMAAGSAAGGETDLLNGLSGGAISPQFPDDEAEDAGDEETQPRGALRQEIGGGSAADAGTGGEPGPEALSLSDEALGTDDLLSALRAEAMREKKRDDTSLLRDLKGVRVTGRQLLEELDSLVREMRGK